MIDTHTSTYGYADWWLRSPYNDGRISQIRYDGYDDSATEHYNSYNGIVPAIKIKLS